MSLKFLAKERVGRGVLRQLRDIAASPHELSPTTTVNAVASTVVNGKRPRKYHILNSHRFRVFKLCHSSGLTDADHPALWAMRVTRVTRKLLQRKRDFFSAFSLRQFTRNCTAGTRNFSNTGTVPMLPVLAIVTQKVTHSYMFTRRIDSP